MVISVILTNDKQGIPLPLSCPTRAVNGMSDLGVGVGDVSSDLFGTLVDLLDGRLLLVHKLCDFLVQPSKFNHILLNLANCGRTLQSSLSGIVGLTGPATSKLHHAN